MATKRRITVLTGAGISAESGLQTFRDSDGLWENFRIEDVATPEAFAKDPALVLAFYNMRRKACAQAQPNAAHFALAELQQDFDVRIITQNIDDLHERAGSENVLHLHGCINFMRSALNEESLFPYDRDITVGDLAPDGGQFRPHIVWFGEAVPNIERAHEMLVWETDIAVLIGSSLSVYPAAGLLSAAPDEIPKYVVDRKIPTVRGLFNVIPIELPATQGVPQLRDLLLASVR